MLVYIKDDFKDLLDFRRWVDEKFNNLELESNRKVGDLLSKETTERLIQSDPTWFGKGVDYNQLAQGVTEYRSPELIEKVLSKVESQVFSELRDQIKSPKMNYNSRGLGVFVFDRAAMGLFKAKELYSKKHNRIVQERETKLRNEKRFLKSDNSEVSLRFEQDQNGKHKVRTSSKEVFAWFPKVSKEKNAIDIIISVGAASNIDTESMLYSGISAIVVAKMLEQAQIPTRISILIGTSPDHFTTRYFGCLIPVKDHDQPLDMNLLALLSSDSRFYRFDGFKSIISAYDHFRHPVSRSMGLGADQRSLRKVFENSNYPKEKLSPNRYYFGRTFTEKDALAKIQSTIAEIKERMEEQ